MKKALLAILLLAGFFLPKLTYSQTFTYTIDSLLIHLDKSPITTGILYDRAWPIANVQSVNKISPDTLSNDYFKQAYLEMLTSAYSQSGWVISDSIGARVTSARIAGYTPVGISFYTFNAIDTGALRNNLIQMHSDSLY